MPKKQPPKPPKRPITPFTITIHIPEELGLKQEQVDKYKEKFIVELAGTLGSTKKHQIVILPFDTPSNDY